MPFYHVGTNPIALKKGLEQDDYLASLDENYNPANPQDGQTIFVFDDIEKAKEAASWGRDKKDKEQLPIFTVELAKGAKKKKGNLELEYDEENKESEKLAGFHVNETDVTLTEVAFPHVNKMKLALEITAEASSEEDNEEEASASASASASEEEEKEEVKEKPKNNKQGKKGKGAKDGEANADKPGFFSKLSAFVKANWPHVTFPTAIGAGLFGSGAVPAIVSQLPAALTTMLPAGVAGAGVVAGVAGIAAYAAAYAVYALANKAYSAYQLSKRSPKQKHDDEVNSLTAKVTELEKALGLKEDNSIVIKFADRVAKAPDDTFNKKDGKLNKAAPEDKSKVKVLQWEIAKLQAAKAAKKDEDREEILSKAKNARGLKA